MDAGKPWARIEYHIEAATQQIAEYFKDKDVTPIRIFLNEGG